jgi:hypothetical protein
MMIAVLDMCFSDRLLTSSKVVDVSEGFPQVMMKRSGLFLNRWVLDFNMSSSDSSPYLVDQLWSVSETSTLRLCYMIQVGS